MRILADSDFLIAIFRENDALHTQALRLLKKIQKNKAELYISNWVRAEAVTVISFRLGMTEARLFADNLQEGVGALFVDEVTFHQSWGLFLSQNKKGSSFVDCSNLILLEKFNFDGIASFDKFYPKTWRLG